MNSTFTGINQSRAAYGLSYGGPAEGVVVSNSRFSSNRNHGIALCGVNGLTLVDVTSTENVQYGWYIDGPVENTTITDCSSIDNISTGVVLNTASCTGMLFEYFTSRGNGGNGYTIINAGTEITFKNCDGSDNRGDGFNVCNGWCGVLFDGCRADSCGDADHAGSGDGFTTHNTASITMRYCSARDNYKSGFAGVGDSDVRIYYSRFSHATNGIIGMIFMSGTGEIILHNNTIYSGATNVGAGIDVAAGCCADIRNNIIRGFSVGIAVGAGASLIEGHNNIFLSANRGMGFPISSSDVSYDPWFYNGQNDLRIRRGSGCVNKGTGLGYNRDYGNNPIRGNPDIGSWEVVNSGSGIVPMGEPYFKGGRFGWGINH